MLRRKLDDKADRILTPPRLREAMRYFETTIKYAFNPCSDSCETEFDVPLPGAPDTPDIKLEDGFLQLTKFLPFYTALTGVGMRLTECSGEFLIES
jgi:hypothetical protein